MLLPLASWPEIEAYLARSKGVVAPIGSTEQHGPNGLLGTDAICPEVIAREAGAEAGFLVAPTFSVGMAQHHLGFPGSITLRPSTMIAALQDWIASFARHGFTRIYFLNGHGGNIATIQAAFSEVYAGASLSGAPTPLRLMLRNWWELAGVAALERQLFPKGLGSHATPSEVSVTYYAYPEAAKSARMSPKIAPSGAFADAADYRAKFPDGRIGSNPALASAAHGAKLVAVAKAALIAEVAAFFGEAAPARAAAE